MSARQGGAQAMLQRYWDDPWPLLGRVAKAELEAVKGEARVEVDGVQFSATPLGDGSWRFAVTDVSTSVTAFAGLWVPPGQVSGPEALQECARRFLRRARIPSEAAPPERPQQRPWWYGLSSWVDRHLHRER